MTKATARLTSLRQCVGRFTIQVDEWTHGAEGKARWLIEQPAGAENTRPVFVLAGLVTDDLSAGSALESGLQVAIGVAALMEAALVETHRRYKHLRGEATKKDNKTNPE